MNREIKFRGLRTDGGGWVEGSLVIFENGQACIVNHTHLPKLSIKSERFIEVHPKTVGQFTGRKDKNGREFFEGDSISFQYEDKLDEKGFGICEGIIVYENGCFLVKQKDFIYTKENPISLNEWLSDDDCQIIGNIHEKQKQNE
jgi:uncharacterized phage protein (TIGR01671 family)